MKGLFNITGAETKETLVAILLETLLVLHANELMEAYEEALKEILDSKDANELLELIINMASTLREDEAKYTWRSALIKHLKEL